jgi:integrase
LGCRPSRLWRFHEHAKSAIEQAHEHLLGAVLRSGKKRHFRAPLSPAMVRCLCRARIAGRIVYDRQSREWVFPAASRSGHVEKIKGSSWVNGTTGDKRKIVRLTKVGHSLRHSYRTLCAAAAVDRLRTKLLMNHQVNRDVTDAYLSTTALFDQLRDAQRTVSDLIIRSAGQHPDGKLTQRLLENVPGRRQSSPAKSRLARSGLARSGGAKMPRARQ